MERSFPEAFVERINKMGLKDIKAEPVQVDMVQQGDPTDARPFPGCNNQDDDQQSRHQVSDPTQITARHFTHPKQQPQPGEKSGGQQREPTQPE